MKENAASHVLKALLLLFAVGAIFAGAYVVPALAEESVYYYPELSYARTPLLILCESLIFLLLAGIAVIVVLLRTFDRGDTFSRRFIRGLDLVFVLCILASLGVAGALWFLGSLGGPGPMLWLLMMGLILLIWIVAAVIMLIRTIVGKAMVYKDDYDLTV